MQKEKVAYVNKKPSVGGPAWETLNGVRSPLNSLQGEKQLIKPVTKPTSGSPYKHFSKNEGEETSALL